jgi:glycosyltransferase involved in cell wall biosynthesis
MTLHLVHEKEWVPSTRIRLVQLAPALAARGWPSRIAQYPADAGARERFASELGPGDVVLVHRARPSRSEARWWRALPVPIVYDFDDAIMFGRRGGVLGALSRRRRAAGFRRMLACSDAVACGNSFLASQCAGFAGPVCVVPSAVAGDVPQADPRRPGPLRVGWVGRASNLRYLRAIAPALARAARQRPLVLVVLSDQGIELPGVPVECVPWRLEDEARAVARFDVGLMPLDLAGPWSRGKCAYKLLQYMAAGVPAIGSDVGMNAELIEHDRNGLLASDPRDWERLLVELADDPDRRARLGAAGRRTVLEAYTVEAVADRLTALLDGLRGDAAPSRRDSVASTTGATANASALRRSASAGGG